MKSFSWIQVFHDAQNKRMLNFIKGLTEIQKQYEAVILNSVSVI